MSQPLSEAEQIRISKEQQRDELRPLITWILENFRLDKAVTSASLVVSEATKETKRPRFMQNVTTQSMTSYRASHELFVEMAARYTTATGQHALADDVRRACFMGLEIQQENDSAEHRAYMRRLRVEKQAHNERFAQGLENHKFKWPTYND